MISIRIFTTNNYSYMNIFLKDIYASIEQVNHILSFIDQSTGGFKYD